jgi:hypothetical protein
MHRVLPQASVQAPTKFLHLAVFLDSYTLGQARGRKAILRNRFARILASVSPEAFESNLRWSPKTQIRPNESSRGKHPSDTGLPLESSASAGLTFVVVADGNRREAATRFPSARLSLRLYHSPTLSFATACTRASTSAAQRTTLPILQ